ncbi:hypothetical protein ES703_50514 [subsurface metagenome]|jgi:hypothetical protein
MTKYVRDVNLIILLSLTSEVLHVYNTCIKQGDFDYADDGIHWKKPELGLFEVK